MKECWCVLVGPTVAGGLTTFSSFSHSYTIIVVHDYGLIRIESAVCGVVVWGAREYRAAGGGGGSKRMQSRIQAALFSFEARDRDLCSLLTLCAVHPSGKWLRGNEKKA